MTLGKVLTLTRDAAQHEECVTNAASAACGGPEWHTHTNTHISVSFSFQNLAIGLLM